MDRRTFLTAVGAATIAPASFGAPQPVVGLDFSRGPDKTVYRLLSVRRGAIHELHRVTGIPRYVKDGDGFERDTWQDQVDAGQSTIIVREGDLDKLDAV